EAQLGVTYRPIGLADDMTLLESEGLAQPLDRRSHLAIAQGGHQPGSACLHVWARSNVQGPAPIEMAKARPGLSKRIEMLTAGPSRRISNAHQYERHPVLIAGPRRAPTHAACYPRDIPAIPAQVAEPSRRMQSVRAMACSERTGERQLDACFRPRFL